MVELTWILDPEVVIPGDAAAATPDFWERMLARSADHRPRLGPATFAALGALADRQPRSEVVSDRDFWAILGRYMSRVLEPTNDTRAVPDAHLRSEYRPALGASNNAALLLEDLRSAPNLGQVVLSTVRECWSHSASSCEYCESAGLHMTYASADDPSEALRIARAYRCGHLKDQPKAIDSIRPLQKNMFPHLDFHPSAWDRVSSLVGPDEENGPKLIQHLSVLNDHARQIWRDNMSREDRQAAMQALGVTCSPDSTQTHKKSGAMKERDFQFGDSLVRCEWHTKLRPNVNRIHFNADGPVVRIGTIVDHLTI